MKVTIRALLIATAIEWVMLAFFSVTYWIVHTISAAMGLFSIIAVTTSFIGLWIAAALDMRSQDIKDS